MYCKTKFEKKTELRRLAENEFVQLNGPEAIIDDESY